MNFGYGITADELGAIAENARVTMGFLFELDPVQISPAQTVALLQAAYQ